MTKAADTGLTTLFLVYFAWYILMGMAFGGLSRDNYMFYVFLTSVGLVCILISVITKLKRSFIWTRLIGLLLVPALIFFDVKNSYTFEKCWENIKNILTYLPTVVFAVYTFYSVIRLSTVARQNAANSVSYE